ncbi:DNA-binding domain-containing protein [Ferrovibrio sp.]|uniref:HvfC/BufC N-terminal domain-containing protein n=1 Tax=Ferrovibrio sp. TaxID=1917215 RepID=UPI002604088C|nr:DNA-binding domain-containing protein [Ferrovibrio sp.]
MSGLAPLQAGFSAYLLDETDATPLLPAVRVPDGINAAARLDVYRNAYVERLHDVLRTDYPVLGRLMGEERFAALAYAYIAASRSASPTIRWFGGGLPAFLAAQPRWRDDGAACAMAAFEWSIGLAFDAADAPAICAADLSAVSVDAWPALRFRLHPALRMIALPHAVPDWWLAVRDLDEAAVLPPVPPLEDAARHWAIWRGQSGVRFRMVDPDEAAMLRAAGQGEDFAGLCAVVAEHGNIEAAPARAAGLLRLWIDSGWIAGFDQGR